MSYTKRDKRALVIKLRLEAETSKKSKKSKAVKETPKEEVIE